MNKTFLYISFRYWNTIRYLKFTQIFGRINKFLKINFIKKSKNNDLRPFPKNWIQPVSKKQSMFGERIFFFLNEYHEIKNKEDWNNKFFPKLWIYNLHYFDDLNAIDAESRVDWHRKLIDSWIDQNPLYQGVGWTPYPSSLRIINWIFSLVLQVRNLKNNLEKHLLGNHLFANATALIYAGLFFKGEESRHWYEIGYEIFKTELSEQILPDGAHFELSTMYHSIILENLLDILNIHNAYNKRLPEKIIEKISSMFLWLKNMSHPDGEISFFNDAAFGISPILNELKDYGSRLSLKDLFKSSGKNNKIIFYKHCGYSRIETDDVVALIDRSPVGPDYLPGHAHADTLSFELSIFKKRVIVNSGTSIYENVIERELQRGTAAHSTIVIDKEDSSEVWDSFRVARRARVFDIKNSEEELSIKLSAAHNGYHRLKGKPTHYRSWEFKKNTLIIEDRIIGNGKHSIEAILPLHPEVKLKGIHGNKATLEISKIPIEILIDGNGLLEAKQSNFNAEFGLSIENIKLVYFVSDILPVFIKTIIKW